MNSPNHSSGHPADLLVDIPQKAEIVRNRVAFIMVMGLMAVLVFLMFLLSVQVGSIMARTAAALPDIRLLENWHPSESTRIFDRQGNLVANIHGDEDRVVVPLAEISPHIQRAVMAIEDNRFYQHSGVDVRGTMRAMIQNLKRSEVQGGSTITQQLVKNLFLTPERSIGRKIAEAALAMRVEQYYPKNKILEMYLNQVYWGNQAYGIEKAARRYFKKGASDLSIGEAALLAGLLKAPEGLSPYAYPEAANRRKAEVLNNMVEYGYITPEQKNKALNEAVTLSDRKVKPSKHPFFVTYVIQELNERYGEDIVRRGGLKVYTTMDEEVQSAAEKALEDGIVKLPKSSQVTEGALVALDVQTGEIIAMVGGTDFNKNQFNNATQARRAAGSTFKPLVYLTGFRLGLITPDSPISDRPVSFNTGYSIWTPRNWDGKFMGGMNIRRALTLSRNTPTVQIGMRVGIDEVVKTARLAGVTSHIDRNFSSLLGSSGFSPLEMTNVYATFARGGVRMDPSGIRRIEDSRGKPVPWDKSEPTRVFDPDSVSNLVSILVDVVEKGTGRSAMLPNRKVAGKTGTTDKVRDIWFAGFTPDMVAVVWMGNEKYVPLRGVFSSNAAKVWHDFAAKYYEIKPVPPSDFPQAAPMTKNPNWEKEQEKHAPAKPKVDDDDDFDEVPAHFTTPPSQEAFSPTPPELMYPRGAGAGAMPTPLPPVAQPSTNLPPLPPEPPSDRP
jgi:penicillin-binding protein 1A